MWYLSEETPINASVALDSSAQLDKILSGLLPGHPTPPGGHEVRNLAFQSGEWLEISHTHLGSFRTFLMDLSINAIVLSGFSNLSFVARAKVPSSWW